MQLRRCGATLTAIGALAIAVAAQDGRVRFETASVKAAVGGVPMAQRVFPGRIDFVNTPLRNIIWIAFGITDTTEAEIPAWTSSSRFDIQATYPDGATRAELPAMLQALLRDRFGLVTRVEARRIDGYELVVGTGGVRMREVEPADDLDTDFSAAPGPRVTQDSASESVDGRVRQMLIPEEIGFRRVTARTLYEFRTLPNGVQRIDATRMSMPELAGLLRLNVGKPVFDRTSLSGVYQFATRFDRLALPITLVAVDGAPLNREPTGVSTFKAVEELGLRLQALRGPVDVLVVDSLNRVPTDN